MNKRLLLFAALCLFVAKPAAATQLFVTDLVNGSGNLPIPGNQAWGGMLGDDFTVDSSIKITDIGVFDDDGDGTADILTWQLYRVDTGVLIHSEEVSATVRTAVGSSIEDNYVFQKLLNPITLTPGLGYSLVAFGFDAVDKNFNTNFNLANFDVVFNSFSISSAGGRYSSVGDTTGLPEIGASFEVSTQPYNFGAASFKYTPVPEPGTLLLLGIGLVGLAGYGWKKKLFKRT